MQYVLLMRKIYLSMVRVYRFLYEINQRMLKAVEMVTWLDADTLPQKSPSVGNNKTNGKTDKDKDKDRVDDRGGAGTALEAAADDVDNISIGSKSASKNSLASMMKSILPLPSFRQRHQCPFEVCTIIIVCLIVYKS